jgi:hypothetical protein
MESGAKLGVAQPQGDLAADEIAAVRSRHSPSFAGQKIPHPCR